MMDLSKKRIKITERRNLNLIEGQLVAQGVHAAFGLAGLHSIGSELCAHDLFRWAHTTTVVFKVSDKKYEDAKAAQVAAGNPVYIFFEDEYTNDGSRLETAMAWLEDNPKEEPVPICTQCHKPIQVECAFGNCKPEENDGQPTPTDS